MDKKDNGGPAFPAGTHKMFDEECHIVPQGMSLRDYFAGQALMGMTINRDALDYNSAGIAACSYQIADAMLAAREGK